MCQRGPVAINAEFATRANCVRLRTNRTKQTPLTCWNTASSWLSNSKTRTIGCGRTLTTPAKTFVLEDGTSFGYDKPSVQRKSSAPVYDVVHDTDDGDEGEGA